MPPYFRPGQPLPCGCAVKWVGGARRRLSDDDRRQDLASERRREENEFEPIPDWLRKPFAFPRPKETRPRPVKLGSSPPERDEKCQEGEDSGQEPGRDPGTERMCRDVWDDVRTRDGSDANTDCEEGASRLPGTCGRGPALDSWTFRQHEEHDSHIDARADTQPKRHPTSAFTPSISALARSD